MSLVNIAEDRFQVDDWCLNHLFSPNVKKEVISGYVLALDNHCCKLLIISECWYLVDTAGHVRLWRRCSSRAWHLGQKEHWRCFLRTITLHVVVSSLNHLVTKTWIDHGDSFLAILYECQCTKK